MGKTYKLVISGMLPGLNELINAERTHRQKGARLKRDAEMIVRLYIRQQLRGARPKTPVMLHYHFYEKTHKRDLDGIFSFAAKVIQDSLVKEGILDNDGWAHINGFTAQFDIDRQNQKIVVVIAEAG